MDIAARIVELRKDRGYSTNKLAHLAGIAQSTLREIEIGRTSPTWDTILKICRALGIRVTTLVENDLWADPDVGEGALEEALEGYRAESPPDLLRIVNAARRLTPRQRKILVDLLEEWAQVNRP